jgi:hypothetical protein
MVRKLKYTLEYFIFKQLDVSELILQFKFLTVDER